MRLKNTIAAAFTVFGLASPALAGDPPAPPQPMPTSSRWWTMIPEDGGEGRQLCSSFNGSPDQLARYLINTGSAPKINIQHDPLTGVVTSVELYWADQKGEYAKGFFSTFANCESVMAMWNEQVMKGNITKDGKLNHNLHP